MIDAKQELLAIINKHMESASPSVCERLKTELDYITKNEGTAEIYMAAQGMIKLSRELGYYSNSRLDIGSSLIAYILGITEVDSLKYNIPFEVFAGLDYDRQPYIHLNFDKGFIPHAQRYMQDNFPDVPMWPEDGWPPSDGRAAIVYSDFQACAKIKKVAEITGVDISSIPFDDAKTLDMLIAAETSGIPTFESDFARNIIMSTRPKTFDDFVTICGLSNGSYMWAEWDDDTKENHVISELPAYSEIIVFRDDVMLYLMDKSIDRATAYEIMTSVRKGKGLTAEHEDIMAKANVPNWYIESCKSVKYILPRASAVSDTMLAFRIAWFKLHYPAEFSKSYQEIEGYIEEFVIGVYDAHADLRAAGKLPAIMLEATKSESFEPYDPSIITDEELEMFRKASENK